MAPRARQAKSKARIDRLREDAGRGAGDEKLETRRDLHPAGTAAGRRGHRGRSTCARAYGDNLLIDDLSFKLPPGGIVGVIGPNGAGKTTLFRMIIGQEKPDAGTLRVGDDGAARLRRPEPRRARRPSKTSGEEITDGKDEIELGKRTMTSRAYVASFNFKGADQQKRVRDLSGGERNRVHLAKLLKAGGNVLLLDEPTNDLDVDTLRALEEALLDFAGCAVVISHDRWFLDRIATHILAFEGDSAGRLVRGQLPGLRGRPPRSGWAPTPTSPTASSTAS